VHGFRETECAARRVGRASFYNYKVESMSKEVFTVYILVIPRAQGGVTLISSARAKGDGGQGGAAHNYVLSTTRLRYDSC
jgi:hypothetical protein